MLNFLKTRSFTAPTRKAQQGGLETARPDALRMLKPAVPKQNSMVDEESLWALTLLDFIGDAVVSTNTEAKITHMNTAAEALTGFSSQEATGLPLQTVFQVIDVETRRIRRNLARQTMSTGQAVPLHNSALLITRDGRELAIEDAAKPLHDCNGKIVGAVIKFHDSRYSDVNTDRLAYLAQHDALTGLLNRHAFSERFTQAASLARRHQKKMVLLFLDLDNFKAVNDTLGHVIGDNVLKKLGDKLRSSVRTTDHVCRHGGDEFLVLLSDLTQHEQAFAVVDKIRESTAELSRLSNDATVLALSIGLSIYPDQGTTLEALLPQADADM